MILAYNRLMYICLKVKVNEVMDTRGHSALFLPTQTPFLKKTVNEMQHFKLIALTPEPTNQPLHNDYVRYV